MGPTIDESSTSSQQQKLDTRDDLDFLYKSFTYIYSVLTGDSQSSTINLSCLLKPEAFLTAYRRYISHELRLDYNRLFLRAYEEFRENRLAICGIQLQGFRFLNGEASICDREIITRMPAAPQIYIEWTEDRHVNTFSCYDVPVYGGIKRDREIFSIFIACKDVVACSLANISILIQDEI